MSRLLVVAAVVCGSVLPISAQDPTKTLPDSYKVQLDNPFVRVVRVHYEAGAKLAEHTHPGGTTVYVYLNDSEGVTFSHSGNSNRSVTRPKVTTGAIRIASGGEEHHTAENPASTPTDFLRIWFKTDNGGERNLRRRMPPTDQEFANKQMRVTRVSIAAGKPITIDAPASQPALIVSLPTGDTQWVDGGKQIAVSAAGEYVRIDVLTAPK